MSEASAPAIGADQIALLEKLSNANAVSGDEGQVRKIVIEELKKLGLPYQVDALGNVLVETKPVRKGLLRVLVDAHMDEVGFMITSDEKDGLFTFERVGGIDERVLPGKSVIVGRDNILGVIGTKPIHMTTRAEREEKIPISALRIDVGGNGGKVKVGDRGTFGTKFRVTGPSLIGKALDDRLGVATLLELLREPPSGVHLLASFSVQEEIGLRGARVAAYRLNPDVAIAVDSTPANDLPAWDREENTAYNTRLGAGPAIYVVDGSTLSDPRLVSHFLRTAEKNGIPCQVRQPGGGGTDAGSMHLVREGVASISVSIPARYAHTAALIARQVDWENTLRLLRVAISGLKPALFKPAR